MAKKIANLGLSSEYKDPESEIGRWLKLFFGLQYLHPQDVEDAFAFDLCSEAPESDAASQFSDWKCKKCKIKCAQKPCISAHFVRKCKKVCAYVNRPNRNVIRWLDLLEAGIERRIAKH